MIEYPARIERAGVRFRMELYGHERQFLVDKAFVRAVVRVLEPGTEAARDLFDRKAVVLGREVRSLRTHEPCRLVLTAMPEFHFVRRPARGKRQDLVAKTNPQHGDFFL